ncbi:MAG TPA: hypothetical protein VGR20_09805 [Acidimicrobiia bacterium]|jgi:hypothetical protein|nr:hypothetical protein [Acidimicrobiia bacterium]
MTPRRWALLAAVGVGALVGLSNLPGLGSAAPPGGATLTRRYDPSAAVTTFTVDAGRASGAALSLLTCPGARVLEVDGPHGSQIVEGPGGTTITFPSEAAGSYRVVMAGDAPGLGVGGAPSGCGDATLLIDPAVVERTGAEVGPSTLITTVP